MGRPLLAAATGCLPFLYKKNHSISSAISTFYLAARRMLFDWVVVGHVLDVNPAHAVSGHKHVVKKGQTRGKLRFQMIADTEDVIALLASC